MPGYSSCLLDVIGNFQQYGFLNKTCMISVGMLGILKVVALLEGVDKWPMAAEGGENQFPPGKSSHIALSKPNGQSCTRIPYVHALLNGLD